MVSVWTWSNANARWRMTSPVSVVLLEKQMSILEEKYEKEKEAKDVEMAELVIYSTRKKRCNFNLTARSRRTKL